MPEIRMRFGAWMRVIAPVLIAGLTLLVRPVQALAHPLGNFTINRYSRLEVGGQLRLLYVVDMAEIPTFQEKATIDANQDGAISPQERDQYLAREVQAFLGHLRLSANGAPLVLQPQASTLDFLPGQGGLQTERLTIWFVAAWPPAQTPLQADYQDDNFADRIGWQEVVVLGKDGVQLLASDAPAGDISNELRNYPQDLLQSPSNRHTAGFRFQTVAMPPASPGNVTAQPSSASSLLNPQKSVDPFTALISIPELRLGTILLALLAAFVWGGAHALTPGHGKTIVAAYLVGSRGTVRHALFLGAATTVTHTAGVFALGLLTLFASRFILPEQLYPWLGVASGLMVVAIGMTLFRGRLIQLIRQRAHADEPDHAHEHHHDDMHAYEHSHAREHALATDQDHTDQPIGDYADAHTHEHDHGLAHSHTFEHDHGDGPVHSHLPPGGDGSPLTWRSLLALGISGGLLPCPSALVVMLSAIALQRVGFGLLLIVVFSMGLAAVLTTVGVLFVHAGRLMDRFRVSGRIRFGAGVIRLAPVASALFISAAGLAITYQALVQAGVLHGVIIAFPL
jgi:nickel/cobalt exporter